MRARVARVLPRSSKRPRRRHPARAVRLLLGHQLPERRAVRRPGRQRAVQGRRDPKHAIGLSFRCAARQAAVGRPAIMQSGFIPLIISACDGRRHPRHPRAHQGGRRRPRRGERRHLLARRQNSGSPATGAATTAAPGQVRLRLRAGPVRVLHCTSVHVYTVPGPRRPVPTSGPRAQPDGAPPRRIALYSNMVLRTSVASCQ